MSDVVDVAPPRSDPPRTRSYVRDGWIALGGVVLPVITIGVEWTTRMCAAEFFDPLRTWIHVAGAACVPIVVLWVLGSDRRTASAARRQQVAAWIAFGANLYFAAYFAPIAPLGLLAILMMGLGLLPLAPLLSLVAMTGVLRRTHAADPRFPVGARVACAVGALAVLVLADPLGTWTRVRLCAAIDGGSPVARAVAIDELRRVSSVDTARRVLREGLRPPTDPIAWCLTRSVDARPAETRAVLYQAFGEVVEPQRGLRAPFEFEPIARFDELDGAEWRRRGSDATGFVTGASAVRLARSAYAIDVDPMAATFEVAWELEFANPTGFPEEATGTILLPAGAVASGLTLWVDGQPRDAAFSTREATSNAYRTIVRQQRDPALLVTSGIRRVNLSCFPVPPNGTMRLRIACIAALAPRPDGVADIGAPCFEGGSFAVAPHGVAPLRHAIDVVGLHGISAAHAALRVAAPDRVSGTMTQAELASSPVVATVAIPEPSRARLWDDVAGTTWSAAATPAVAKSSSAFVVVVDGSAAMAERIGWVADALELVDPTADLAVVFAGDRPELLTSGGLSPALPARVREATTRLRGLAAVGGRDNAAALTLAVDLVRDRPDATIVWVHAPQPIRLAGFDTLRVALELADRMPRIVSVATMASPDVVRDQLEAAGVDVDERFDANVGEALTRAVRDARGAAGPTRIGCSVADDAARATGLRIERGVDRWRRLATRDHVLRLLERPEAESIAAAQRLAAQARLVTPVTGAVVLERDEQYAEFGLDAPSDEAGEFSAAPEPETYALVALAGLVLGFARVRRGGGA